MMNLSMFVFFELLHGANLDDACNDCVRGDAKNDVNCDDSR